MQINALDVYKLKRIAIYKEARMIWRGKVSYI